MKRQFRFLILYVIWSSLNFIIFAGVGAAADAPPPPAAWPPQAAAAPLAVTTHLQGRVTNNGSPVAQVALKCTLQPSPAAVSGSALSDNFANAYYFFAPAPNGGIYATAGSTGNLVSIIAPDGSVSTFTATNVNFPLGITVDWSGNVYVANSNAGTISKFDASGVFLGKRHTRQTRPGSGFADIFEPLSARWASA